MSMPSQLDLLHLGQPASPRIRYEEWVGAFAATPVPSDPFRLFAKDLEVVRRQIIHSFPDLAAIRQESKLAEELRSLVSANVRWADTAPETDFEDVRSLVYQSLIERSSTHVCGGIALIYLILAKAFGLKARFVGMFRDVQSVDGSNESHCACEVWLAGQWRAIEPTYDIEYRSARGQPISWRAVREKLLKGGEVLAAPGRAARSRATRFNHHQQRLELLTRHLYLGGCVQVAASRFIGWDGQIRYADGQVYDYRTQVKAGTYRLLES